MSLFPAPPPGVASRARRPLAFVGLVSLLLLAAACNHPGDNRKTIAISLLTKEHVFYQNLQAAMEKAADREGYRLIFTSGEWSLAKQQEHIENFIVQRVDAIVVCPVNSKAIGPSIEEANVAGIPVFTADIRAESGKVVSHVGSDNYQGGRLAGEFLAKALRGTGKVAIIEQPVIESTLERVRGFEDAVKDHPGIEVVAKLNGDGVRDRSMKVAEELLRGFRDVQGIFAINDSTALGVLSALESLGRNDVIVVGFDGDPEALAVLEQGSPLKADIEQYPAEIGFTVIDVIHRHLNGEQVPEAIPIRVTLRAAESPTASR
ncbi:MAG: substrate-binding domain-containing protein [Bryobacterales bacterium]|nr:substrate-binding domain-containing protein [Bryobacterales bacterium]